MIDGTKLNQVGPDGAIAQGAVLANFIAFDASSRGGVSVTTTDLNGDFMFETARVRPLRVSDSRPRSGFVAIEVALGR